VQHRIAKILKFWKWEFWKDPVGYWKDRKKRREMLVLKKAAKIIKERERQQNGTGNGTENQVAVNPGTGLVPPQSQRMSPRQIENGTPANSPPDQQQQPQQPVGAVGSVTSALQTAGSGSLSYRSGYTAKAGSFVRTRVHFCVYSRRDCS